MSQACEAVRSEFIKNQEGHFECAQCDRAFALRANLTRHLRRTHRGEKPHKCEHCDKAFALSGSLKRHLQTHTDMKPYKCRHCDRAFADVSNRRAHELHHTGEKPHKRPWCGKTFAYGDSLRPHERINTGIKPYKCGQCGRAFAAYGNLYKHEKTYHPLAESLRKAKKTAFSAPAGPTSGFADIASSIAQTTPSSLAFAHEPVTMNPMAASLMGTMVRSYAPNDRMCAERMNSSHEFVSPSSHLRPYGDYADATAAQQQHRPSASRTEQIRMASTQTVQTSQNETSTHPTGRVTQGPSASASMEIHDLGEREHTRPIVSDNSQTTKHPFECIVCHRILSGKGTLQAHYRLHPVAERPYKCKICGRALSSSGSLSQHVFMHTVVARQFRSPPAATGNPKTQMCADHPENAVRGIMGNDLPEKPHPVQHTFPPASSAESLVSSPFMSPGLVPATSLTDLPGTALLYPLDLLNFPSRLTVPTFVHRAQTKSDDNAVAAARDKAGCTVVGNDAVPKNAQPQEDVPNDVGHPVNEATTEQAYPRVQPTEPALLEAQAALEETPAVESPLLRAPKQEPDEDVDVELLDEPPVPVSCASSCASTPSLPTLAVFSSLSNSSGPGAYFGDAIYDRPGDPSSFTYESDVYGSFQFMLLDEIEKEEGGQRNIVRLYQCEACLGLSQTHKYKDEVVHTIMTTGQRIVKYDPSTPRGILHLCVRHRRSTITKPAG